MNQPDQTDLERFNALLPFYINGTASDEERLFADKLLQQSEAARTQLAHERELVKHLASAIGQLPDDIGKFAIDSIRREEAARKVSPRTFSEPWWTRLFAAQWARQAMPVALGLLIVMQTGMVAMLLLKEYGVSGVGSSPAASEFRGRDAPPQLVVKFKPDTTEKQIFEILTSIGGRITDGPLQLGDYVIDVDAQDSKVDGMIQSLGKNASVEWVARRNTPGY